MSNLDEQQDKQAIHELRRMAEIYAGRGLSDKARELLQLADRMEARMLNTKRVIDMSEYRNDSTAVRDEEA